MNVPDQLLDVFLPLIGPDGVMVYLALCRLVPVAEANRKKPVTVRACAAVACTSTGATHREMQKMIALGMVRSFHTADRRPPRFELPDLKEVAAAGLPELKRRLSAGGPG